ncbi:hypothetical protein [Rhodococcus marinonascens]|uniref:hypothetical protein n=1 Tax=Rhodococcus marinonascens TaxID=38311 RepID=UPI0009329B59|nr:hypothetical protein [Rhodococcus marinonascens]
MNTRRLKQLLAATAFSAVVAAGAAVPASAAPSANPLAPITAAVASVSDGGSTASTTLPVDALIAARNAGFPIYEAGQIVVVSATKMGAIYATEYRRVYEVDALTSPTTKFVTVGATAPDNFYVVDRHNQSDIVVNMRRLETPWPQPFARLTYHTTPQTWLNSPLVQLQDDGPSIGIALVR